MLLFIIQENIDYILCQVELLINNEQYEQAEAMLLEIKSESIVACYLLTDSYQITYKIKR